MKSDSPTGATSLESRARGDMHATRGDSARSGIWRTRKTGSGRVRRFFDSAVTVSLSRLLVVVIVVALWQWTTHEGWLSSRYFSTPPDVASQLWQAVQGKPFLSTTLWALIGVTMESVLIGYVIGALIGIILGYATARSELAAAIFRPYITIIAGVPKIALVPILILLFGLGSRSAITSAAIMVFIGVVYNTHSGVRRMNPDFIALARLMGTGRWRIMLSVVLPAATPSIFIGLRTAAPLAMIGAVTAEYVGAGQGLGFAVQSAGNTYNTGALFVILVCLLVLTVVFGQLILLIQRRVVRWQLAV